MLEHVEVASWREVMTGASGYDIAFCEGSITREEDVQRIQEIRETAQWVVSLGSCASIGCHNALKNQWSMEEAVKLVYGSEKDMDTIPARPLSAVIDVDYQIHGCPVSLPEFVTVFTRILTKQSYRLPNDPVCVECKRNDHLCVYEKGIVCLGPVTRCGCEAICTAFGDACQGCRGLIDQPNLHAAVQVLTAEKLHPIMDAVARRHGWSKTEVQAKFAVYNNWPELRLEEEDAQESAD
jgi:coenzyme F420-reducing hydrogenase gamma subunit